MDILKTESFKLVQDIIKVINLVNYSYLKKIFITNKMDCESNRQVTGLQIQEYLNSINVADNFELSLKNGDNLAPLIQKIEQYENYPKNEIPINIVSESVSKRVSMINGQAPLSLILIGDSKVGKTCFLTRYFKNTFNETFLSTIGIDKEIKQIKISGEAYKVTLWDTAGQERFKCLPKKYYQNADGVLLLFDVNDEESFNNVSNWMKDVKDNSNSSSSDSENKLALYLIGNKIDLEKRVISREQAEDLAKSLGMKYFEVSCKINMNLTEVMSRLIMECHMKQNHIENCFQLQPKHINQPMGKKIQGCCASNNNKKNTQK